MTIIHDKTQLYQNIRNGESFNVNKQGKLETIGIFHKAARWIYDKLFASPDDIAARNNRIMLAMGKVVAEIRGGARDISLAPPEEKPKLDEAVMKCKRYLAKRLIADNLEAKLDQLNASLGGRAGVYGSIFESLHWGVLDTYFKDAHTPEELKKGLDQLWSTGKTPAGRFLLGMSLDHHAKDTAYDIASELVHLKERGMFPKTKQTIISEIFKEFVEWSQSPMAADAKIENMHKRIMESNTAKQAAVRLFGRDSGDIAAMPGSYEDKWRVGRLLADNEPCLKLALGKLARMRELQPHGALSLDTIWHASFGRPRGYGDRYNESNFGNKFYGNALITGFARYGED